jgi:hypothetical protein
MYVHGATIVASRPPVKTGQASPLPHSAVVDLSVYVCVCVLIPRHPGPHLSSLDTLYNSLRCKYSNKHRNFNDTILFMLP